VKEMSLVLSLVENYNARPFCHAKKWAFWYARATQVLGIGSLSNLLILPSNTPCEHHLRTPKWGLLFKKDWWSWKRRLV